MNTAPILRTASTLEENAWLCYHHKDDNAKVSSLHSMLEKFINKVLGSEVKYIFDTVLLTHSNKH